MKKERVLVSACLLGVNCKYNGSNNFNEKVLKLIETYELIPICPEQLGGLPTPREPSYLSGKAEKVLEGKAKVLSQDKDVTENFIKGAQETLKIARMYGIKKAILQEGSPSCGKNLTYYEKGKGDGMGVTAALLKKNGIKLISEEELERF